MTEFLLKLCGVSRDEATQVSSVEFVLRNREWLGWIALMALVFAVLVSLSYWRDTRERIGPRKRVLLTSLRILLLFVLLLLLLRPVLAFTLETSVRRTLLTLVDASGSMKIQDPRIDPNDLKRAAIARGLLDSTKGLGQSLDGDAAASVKLIPRVDVMRGMLHPGRSKVWAALEKELDLGVFTFGQTLSEPVGSGAVAKGNSTWLDALDPNAPSTALGDAVRTLINRKRGQALAGILLATDGANNVGTSPVEAAQMARREGVPLFIYGVGITSPRDIIVSSLLVQEVAFVKDELPVTVRVRGQGLRGESARIAVTLAPAADGEGKVVATKDVLFTEDEDVALSLPFTPETQGEYTLTAKADPRSDEATPVNNVITQHLRVMDSKVRVLYVESAPRWEFRYLQNVLVRDRRLDAKFVLLEADAGIAEGQGTPYLASIPPRKEDLFKFDLIILGDVTPKDFSAEQLSAFDEFVQKFGGSLLFVSGPRSAPAAFGGSVFEKLLPVELDSAVAQPAGPASGTVVELTPQGRASPMLKLSANEEENARIWKSFGKVYWTARVLRAKPAAQVLLVDADPTRANRHGKLVLAAFQQYGLGQVLYLGTDNTWRWRRNTGDRHYPVLWGQIAQKLGLHHLLGGSKRTQLSADKRSYTTGENVTIYARLYGTDFAPVRDATMEAAYTVRVGGTPGPQQDVVLRAVPDQPGMYRGQFVATLPGTHQFVVKSDPANSLALDVSEPKFESGETAMNEPLLRQMADASGGAYFREENLWQLPATISSKAERVTSTLDGELWSSPIFFLLLLLIGTLEWWLRKRWELK